MDWLHRGDPARGRQAVPSLPPSPPNGLVHQRIRFEPEREPAREEWFIPGTEQSVIRQANATALARITYPAEGTILALDPDIPPGRQRVEFRLSGAAGHGWKWELDGRPLNAASATIRWLPQPGRHRLRLVDAHGSPIDEVSFDVRSLKSRSRLV